MFSGWQQPRTEISNFCLLVTWLRWFWSCSRITELVASTFIKAMWRDELPLSFVKFQTGCFIGGIPRNCFVLFKPLVLQVLLSWVRERRFGLEMDLWLWRQFSLSSNCRLHQSVAIQSRRNALLFQFLIFKVPWAVPSVFGICVTDTGSQQRKTVFY